MNSISLVLRGTGRSDNTTDSLASHPVCIPQPYGQHDVLPKTGTSTTALSPAAITGAACGYPRWGTSHSRISGCEGAQDKVTLWDVSSPAAAGRVSVRITPEQNISRVIHSSSRRHLLFPGSRKIPTRLVELPVSSTQPGLTPQPARKTQSCSQPHHSIWPCH